MSLPAYVQLDATTDCQLTDDGVEIPQSCVKLRWTAGVRGATFEIDGQVLDDFGDGFDVSNGWLLRGALYYAEPMSADATPAATLQFEWVDENIGTFHAWIPAEETWITEGPFWKIEQVNDGDGAYDADFVRRLCYADWKFI